MKCTHTMEKVHRVNEFSYVKWFDSRLVAEICCIHLTILSTIHESYIVIVTFKVVDFDRIHFEVLPPCGIYTHFFWHMEIRNKRKNYRIFNMPWAEIFLQ